MRTQKTDKQCKPSPRVLNANYVPLARVGSVGARVGSRGLSVESRVFALGLQGFLDTNMLVNRVVSRCSGI